jgi:ABC-type multidrug transport system fused ATPase/permease subunit
VDSENEAKIAAALETLMQKRTSLVIAHRLSTTRNADNVVVLSKGRIVQQGTHDELLLDKTGMYARLVRHQLTEPAQATALVAAESKSE